ncbi:hypothetical protein [Nakamurella endophytica]|uniref:hypothetical protein n=1 Tax=Nakamurella endophytica TaxID=1748367 RepID=UPI001667E8B9|nr:hypothetical protein [Nakamurella endophytica]
MQLSAETGAPVEVQWDSSSRSGGWRWHVIWGDGPTRDGMVALVDRLLPPASALDRDKLVYLRTIRRISVALAIVRNMRLGQPPLGEHHRGWALEDHLLEVPYPERGTDDDLQLAVELCRLSNFGDAQSIADLAAQHGIAGLRARLVPPDNVLPFRRSGPR